MRVTVVTAFPELLEPFTRSGVIGKAVEKGILEIRCINPRNHAEGAYGQIDDYAYGSGGMVLMPEPLARAVDAAREEGPATVVYPGPQGIPLGQHLVESLAVNEHLVIVCGRYEGVDERFVEEYVDLEISIGDYVLTGGELPAMVIVDAVSRMISGVVGQESAVEEDSFFRGMLDTPHYTRPASWRGREVPKVLTGGDHEAIRSWRRGQSSARTAGRRPDIIAGANIGPYLDKGVYVILVPATETIPAADLSDMAEACFAFGCKRLLCVVHGGSERKSLQAHAGERVKAVSTMESAFAWIQKREKAEPFTIVSSGKAGGIHWLELKRRALDSGRPLVFVFDMTEKEKIPAGAETAILGPIRGGKGDVSLSNARDAAVVILDRFFGWR
ncbi:MAG: tRNA (guanosine(37)-N1)-methyltransferase TrmD [Thermovirgaceae bacterium]|nr:tRNA (guanosine(37)-N1)-methyltransferase TrmD [Thermovirgaceae bacterium]